MVIDGYSLFFKGKLNMDFTGNIIAIISKTPLLWVGIGWLVVIYIVTMIIDYVTGNFIAVKHKKWCSSTAREGIWKKCGSILAVLAAVITDLLLSLIINNFPNIHLPFTYSALFTPLVLVWYIVTELGSIIENAALMGAKVPAFLRRYLKLLNDSVEDHSTEEQSQDSLNSK